LWYLGWNGFGLASEVWTVIMLAVAVVLAYLMALLRQDIAYLLVLAWAFAGIAVKQAGTPMVSTAAGIAAGLVLVAIGLAIARKPKLQTAAA
jgi:hypothetical protein